MYSSTITQYENLPDKKAMDSDEPTAEVDAKETKQPIIWFNVFGIALLHVIAVYSLLFRSREAQLYTWLFHIFYIIVSGLGVTAGAHRLWAHRSYSANLPLRILLATLFCMMGQTHMHKWIRDHRTHHKFTETAADPHDSRRGFFFSHVGWLMMKRHPAVIEYGKKIDMSDIEADPVIQWFDRYYDFTMCTLCFVIPSLIIHYGWNEPWEVTILSVIVRYVITLNATFCVNSLAHMVGNKPYNKKFRAVENAGVSFFALGEGWHNYHHAFPWDYKAAELPNYGLNLTTAFIDFFASIGWAYNLKTPSKEVIERVSLSKGDGTASKWGVDYHRYKQDDEQKTAMYSSTVTQFEEPPEKKIEEDAEPFPLPVKEEGEQRLIWRNILGIAVLHVLAFYSFFTRYHEAKLGTWIFSPIWGLTAGLGITAGAHRLWAHRSYSAKTPLKIFLAILYCMAGMTHFHKWIRDHRTHHKFTETAADPHDANRGFFFSHVGWLMMKRHPAVKKYGSKVDMSDIEADPVIRFFDKYYEPIMLSLTFVIPTLIPVYCWGESWYCAIHSVIIRYVWLLNATFLVNSFAHMWGNRPYNRNVKPTENPTVSFFTLGEGWHNYHHSFPWDYKAAELPGYGLNASTAFIETMAWLGLAYDLKTPSRELVEKVSVNKGDGSASKWGNDHHKRFREQQKVKTR